VARIELDAEIIDELLSASWRTRVWLEEERLRKEVRKAEREAKREAKREAEMLAKREAEMVAKMRGKRCGRKSGWVAASLEPSASREPFALMLRILEEEEEERATKAGGETAGNVAEKNDTPVGWPAGVDNSAVPPSNPSSVPVAPSVSRWAGIFVDDDDDDDEFFDAVSWPEAEPSACDAVADARDSVSTPWRHYPANSCSSSLELIAEEEEPIEMAAPRPPSPPTLPISLQVRPTDPPSEFLQVPKAPRKAKAVYDAVKEFDIVPSKQPVFKLAEATPTPPTPPPAPAPAPRAPRAPKKKRSFEDLVGKLKLGAPPRQPDFKVGSETSTVSPPAPSPPSTPPRLADSSPRAPSTIERIWQAVKSRSTAPRKKGRVVGRGAFFHVGTRLR